MTENELKHYGVKGMKWGVRKSQQQSGNSTTRRSKSGISTSDIRTSKQIVDEVSKVTKTTENKRRDKRKSKASEMIKNDLSEMSDAELRDIVNRLNMEERYTQVMSSRYADAGKSRVDTLMDKIGTAVTVTSSALTIALAIKELTK